MSRNYYKLGGRALKADVDARLYECKLLKTEDRKDDTYWYVHYPGWNKSHDEWVAEGDLRPWDARRVVQGGGLPPPGSRAAVLVPLPQPAWGAAVAAVVVADWEAEAEAAAKKRKKRRDPPPPTPPKPVDVRLPPELVQVLLADHAALGGWTEKKEGGGDGDAADAADAHPTPPPVAPLPHHPTVDAVLQRYVDDAASGWGRSGGARAATTSFEEGLADSLRDYFDKALPRLLLYDAERPAAAAAAAAGVAPGAVWGARHLLRLVYALPSLLPRLPKGAGAVGGEYAPYAATAARVAHFVAWMGDRRGWLFEGAALEEEEDGEGEEEEGKEGAAGAARSRSRSPVRKSSAPPANAPPPPPQAPPAGGLAAMAVAMGRAEGGK